MASQHPREIELKLEVDADALPRLKADLSPRLGGGTTARLVSVYYDTPHHELRAKGVSVRLRHGNGTTIQTVKLARGASGGLFDRDEWETAVDESRPDLKALAKTPAGELLGRKGNGLMPIFETVVDRTIWLVESKRSSIEIALDEGKVVAGTRTQPLAELELELKRGEPRDLFALVRKLDRVGHLRPGVQAKSERGYQLVGSKAARSYKAGPIPLTRQMTSAEAFQAVVHGCLRHFGLNEPVLIATRSPEPLHQARVALRRLRSALFLFAPFIADDRLPKLKHRLQEISRDLGEARNLDVYLERSAQPEAAMNGDEPGVAAFLREMEARRVQAYDLVIERLQSRAFRILMLDLLEWVVAGPWLSDRDALRAAARDRPIRAYAAAALEKRRRKVKRKGRRLEDLEPSARHRVRIDAKKLRYAAEFFAGLARNDKSRHRHAGFVAALEDLQSHLGDLNDIHTGHEIALSFVGEGATGAAEASVLFAAAQVSGRQDARVDALVAAASDAHASFAKAKRFWSAWLV